MLSQRRLMLNIQDAPKPWPPILVIKTLQNLVDETEKAFGQVDILVCNAAVNPYFGPSADCPDDAFDRVMDVLIKSLADEYGHSRHEGF